MSVAYEKIKLSPGVARRGCVHIRWTLENGEFGTPFEIGAFRDYSIHVTGTVGVGLSYTLKGGNAEAPTTSAELVALTDPQGNPITKSAVTVLEQGEEVVRWIAPDVTAGTGGTIIFDLFAVL